MSHIEQTSFLPVGLALPAYLHECIAKERQADEITSRVMALGYVLLNAVTSVITLPLIGMIITAAKTLDLSPKATFYQHLKVQSYAIAYFGLALVGAIGAVIDPHSLYGVHAVHKLMAKLLLKTEVWMLPDLRSEAREVLERFLFLGEHVQINVIPEDWREKVIEEGSKAIESGEQSSQTIGSPLFVTAIIAAVSARHAVNQCGLGSSSLVQNFITVEGMQNLFTEFMGLVPQASTQTTNV